MCTCKIRKVSVQGEKLPRQGVNRCRMATARPSWRAEGWAAVEGRRWAGGRQAESRGGALGSPIPPDWTLDSNPVTTIQDLGLCFYGDAFNFLLSSELISEFQNLRSLNDAVFSLELCSFSHIWFLKQASLLSSPISGFRLSFLLSDSDSWMLLNRIPTAAFTWCRPLPSPLQSLAQTAFFPSIMLGFKKLTNESICIEALHLPRSPLTPVIHVQLPESIWFPLGFDSCTVAQLVPTFV